MEERELRVKIFVVDSHDEIFDECPILLRVIDQNLMIPRFEEPCEYKDIPLVKVLLKVRLVHFRDVCKLVVITLVIEDSLPPVKLLLDVHTFEHLYIVEI